MSSNPIMITPYAQDYPTSLCHVGFDPSSMNMTLAEGLVNRLQREVVEGNAKIPKVIQWHNKEVVFAGITKMKKAFESFAASIAVSGNIGFISKRSSDKPKDWEVYIFTWEDDCVHHAFSFHLYDVRKNGVVKKAVLTRLSRHALARMISRMRVKDIGYCLLEFMSMHNTATVKSSACATGDQFTVKSNNGVGYFKKEDDGRSICVTWVDDDKLREDQLNVNDDYINLLGQQAEDEGIPFLWFIGYTEAQTNLLYGKWCKTNQGSILDFLFDTESCKKLHRERIE